MSLLPPHTHTAGIRISIMSFSGAEWESVGARSGLRPQLTDEQPCYCAELRGPRSVHQWGGRGGGGEAWWVYGGFSISNQ